MKRSFFLLLLMCMSVSVWALKFPLPANHDDLFGRIQMTRVEPDDDFSSIARRYDVGYYELLEANPGVDTDTPNPGTVLIIPSQYLLPNVPRKGIVINLVAMRLFYFPKGKPYFYTYPIGIGKKGWDTPLGVLHIIEKIKNPIWIVPDSVMKYRREHNDPVDKIMKSGPDNPLGKYAMRLSHPTFLIHGTNEPSSVGRRSSAGCIHLYPKDIKALFKMTPNKTQVFIMNRPYMVGWSRHRLYLKAHLPLEEQRKKLSNVPVVVLNLIAGFTEEQKKGNPANVTVNWAKASEVLKEHTGVPTMIQSGEIKHNAGQSEKQTPVKPSPQVVKKKPNVIRRPQRVIKHSKPAVKYSRRVVKAKKTVRHPTHVVRQVKHPRQVVRGQKHVHHSQRIVKHPRQVVSAKKHVHHSQHIVKHPKAIIVKYSQDIRARLRHLQQLARRHS